MIWFTFLDSDLIYMEDFYQQYFEIEKTISRIVKDEPFGDVIKLPNYVFLTIVNLYLSFLLTYIKVKVKIKNFMLQGLFESTTFSVLPRI